MTEKNNKEKKLEKELEKKIEKSVGGAVKKGADKIGEVIAIIINFVFIIIVPKLTEWDYSFLDFIQDDFDKILWAVYLSLGVSIVTKVIKLANDNKRIWAAAQIGDNLFSLLLLAVTIIVFPYDFKEFVDVSWINTFVKGVLLLASFGIVAATVVEVIKLIPDELKLLIGQKKE